MVRASLVALAHITWWPTSPALDHGFARPGSLLLWTIGTTQPPLAIGQHTDAINAVAFTPDGRGIISASEDGFVRMFDVSGVERMAQSIGEPARFVALVLDHESKDGGILNP